MKGRRVEILGLKNLIISFFTSIITMKCLRFLETRDRRVKHQNLFLVQDNEENVRIFLLSLVFKFIWTKFAEEMNTLDKILK
jgi:hypothetical protein